MTDERQTPDGRALPEVEPVTLHLRPEVHRAFRRCLWIVAHETGRDQVEIMDEMVHDFLLKHGC